MKVVSLNKQHAVLEVTEDDVSLLANCINEATELQEEFCIRTGYSLEEAATLWQVFADMLRRFRAE